MDCVSVKHLSHTRFALLNIVRLFVCANTLLYFTWTHFFIHSFAGKYAHEFGGFKLLQRWMSAHNSSLIIAKLLFDVVALDNFSLRLPRWHLSISGIFFAENIFSHLLCWCIFIIIFVVCLCVCVHRHIIIFSQYCVNIAIVCWCWTTDKMCIKIDNIIATSFESKLLQWTEFDGIIQWKMLDTLYEVMIRCRRLVSDGKRFKLKRKQGFSRSSAWLEVFSEAYMYNLINFMMFIFRCSFFLFMFRWVWRRRILLVDFLWNIKMKLNKVLRLLY